MKTSTTLAATAARRSKLSKGCKISKKAILVLMTAAIMCCMFSVPAFATSAGKTIQTADFLETVKTILQTVVTLIGAGVGVWGVVNLLEGYGNDNAGAKSQGMKQLMAGLGLIILGMVLVPVLVRMMQDAL